MRTTQRCSFQAHFRGLLQLKLELTIGKNLAHATLSRDGQRLVCCVGNHRLIRTWDTASGRELHDLTDPDPDRPQRNLAADFDQSGHRLVTAGPATRRDHPGSRPPITWHGTMLKL
jgi:hypothetical protein